MTIWLFTKRCPLWTAHKYQNHPSFGQNSYSRELDKEIGKEGVKLSLVQITWSFRKPQRLQ